MDMEGIAYRFTISTRGGRCKIQGNLTPDAVPSFSNQVSDSLSYFVIRNRSKYLILIPFCFSRLKKLGQVPKSATLELKTSTLAH
jgi:hypothetical protein